MTAIITTLAVLLLAACAFAVHSYVELRKERKLHGAFVAYAIDAAREAQTAKTHLKEFSRKPLIINITGDQIETAIAQTIEADKKKLLN